MANICSVSHPASARGRTITSKFSIAAPPPTLPQVWRRNKDDEYVVRAQGYRKGSFRPVASPPRPWSSLNTVLGFRVVSQGSTARPSFAITTSKGLADPRV